MKKSILMCCLLLAGELQAQESKNNLIYPSVEMSLGTHLGVGLNLNYVIKEAWSLQMGYSAHIRESKSVPSDNTGGLLSLLPETDEIQNFSISIGKIFKLSPSGNGRMNLLGGIAFSTLDVPTNWNRLPSSSWATWLVGNYTYDYKEYKMVSVIITPRFEFPKWRGFGWNISPLIIINKDMPVIGFEFGIMTGKLR